MNTFKQPKKEPESRLTSTAQPTPCCKPSLIATFDVPTINRTEMSRLNEETNNTKTITVIEEPIDPTVAVQQLTLSPELSHEPRVRWSADTIDNEFLGRHKSKCCCIYKKSKKWDESSDNDSDSDCETNHCRGHVEKRFRPLSGGDGDESGPSCSS